MFKILSFCSFAEDLFAIKINTFAESSLEDLQRLSVERGLGIL